LIKKADSFTNQEFHQYWQHEHPKIWLSVKIVQENVVKYSQFHVDNATSEGLKAHGLPIAEYDGGVNIWARNMEELMAIFQDEEYLRVVVPDEEKFLKRNEATMMLGKDVDLWVDGKVVVLSRDKDS